MDFRLQISSKNVYPKEGILIKGANPDLWLYEIQKMGLELDKITVFPLPDVKANEVFGCLVFNKKKTKVLDTGKNNFCQLVENKLFIPENTNVFPILTKEEWQKLFSENYHFLHPVIGLVELNDEVNWDDFIKVPKEVTVAITEPSKSVVIPKFISSFTIEVDQEEILKHIENPLSEEEIIEKLPFNMKKLMQGNNREMDKFLAYLEKHPEKAMQLAIPLDTLGTSRGGNGGTFSFNSGIGELFNFGWIRRFFDNLSSGGNNSTGFFRYGFVLLFMILARSCKGSEVKENLPSILVFVVILIIVIFLISLWAGSQSGSSGSVSGGSFLIDSNRFNTLRSRYEKLAQDYIARKEYEKASHIYLKLLKNNHQAAKVLEDGGLYREAGSVYLKYLQNKIKAAELYEKGHAYNEALALYKELNQDEKTGDLYLLLHNKSEADKYFNKVISNYKAHSQYVKASLIYKNKIGDRTQAQDLLLEGWRTNQDAGKCLNNYFANISDAEALEVAIRSVYKNDVKDENASLFLHLLKYEHSRFEEIEEVTRNIAYEIVASRIDKNPEIASELIHYAKNNSTLLKDVGRYKLKAKRS
ncbi:hypothetical protein ACFFLS_25300 [Flavobacterium procerum]|uniref:MoxR-vWA-beta-propeller ternary system domain-containing protein n=1 Tax=Flavobacterium procerum TaxID=1455569 RepID=A0ABV6C260_9FLAO